MVRIGNILSSVESQGKEYVIWTKCKCECAREGLRLGSGRAKEAWD